MLIDAFFGALALNCPITPRFKLQLEVLVVLRGVLVARDALQRGVLLGPLAIQCIKNGKVHSLMSELIRRHAVVGHFELLL